MANSTLDDFSEIISSKYGFFPSPKKIGDICFAGKLEIVDLNIFLEVRFFDEYLVSPPEVRLVDWKYDTQLRLALGKRHISSDGILCYFDESRDFWDSSQPIRQFLGAMERIHNILESSISKKNTDSWLHDFNGYWNSSQKILLNSKPQNKDELLQFFDGKHWWLSHENSDSSYIKKSKTSSRKWVTIKLPSCPIPRTEDWPPTSLRTMLICLREIIDKPEKLIARSICKFRKREKEQKDFGIAFYWEDDIQSECIGLSFELSEELHAAYKQGRYEGLSKLLLNKFITVPIERYTLLRADPAFIHSRSLPTSYNTLKNKKVLLIGAGAIGGYLSKELSSLGAGWGTKGQLLIVDNDILTPSNIGRHYLGLKAIGKPKSIALAESLKEDFPHLKITPLTESVFSSKDAFSQKPDLVINATGSETVSVGLEKVLQKKFKDRPPIIHSWILGHGLAVQSFFRESERNACFQCLWVSEGKDRKRKHEISKEPEKDLPKFAPCHQSFYPYVVNAATTCASLTSQMITNWLQGIDQPSLRSIVLQPDKCQNRKDTTPERAKNCLVCGHI